MALAIAVHNIPEVKPLTNQILHVKNMLVRVLVMHLCHVVMVHGVMSDFTHVILQGVIVAAPVYAATGSRWKAMGIATASVTNYCILL